MTDAHMPVTIRHCALKAKPGEVVSSSLRQRVLRAGSWSLAGHAASNTLRLASSLVMTRLLVPEMFGVMAIASVALTVLSLLTDVGLKQAIVQSPRGNQPELLNTAWAVQVLRGLFIWLACIGVGAVLLAAARFGGVPPDSAYSSQDLPYVVAAIGFTAVLAGFQSTNMMSAHRDLKLGRVIQIEILSQVSGIVAMIGLGWATRSIWSIVAGGIVSSAVGSWLSHTWMPGARNRWAFDRAALAEIVGFGRWVFASSILGVLATNADRVLIGAWFDSRTLGCYAIAQTLATVMEALGYRLFGSVSMPALSEAARHGSQRFRTVYNRMKWPTDAAFVGMAGFLFAVGSSIVNVLYDTRYVDAGPLLQLLSFGLLFSRYSLAHNAYLALGKPEYLTAIHVVKLLSMVTLVPGLYMLFGLRGAVLGVAIHLVPTLPLMFWFNRRHGLNNMRAELLSGLAWPLGWAAGSVLAAFAVRLHA